MKKITYLLLLFVCFSFAQNTGKVKFFAKIENRNSDTLTIYGPKKFKHKIPVNKKGVFESSFDITEGLHQFNDGVESSMLYLKDGDDLKLNMDAKEFDETIVYKGKGEKENNYLAQKALSDEAFEMELENLLEKEEAVFKAALDKKKTDDLAKLEGNGLNEKFVGIYKPMITQESVMLLQYYNQKAEAKKTEGTQSTSFEYENHKGGKTKLEDLRGKYVYIDVWATWCGPCRAEIPHLKKVEEKYHGKNIEFVSISVDVDKDHEKWQKFVTDKELGGIQLFADKNWNSDFIKAFGINSIPRFILIDPSGKVVKSDAPRPSSVQLIELLDELLQK
ncbi:MAG TPA: TlpA disulfide reductase family protein [Flavobacterium sp.]|uniref:TlpA family protein disulfide reductase n=1 Tax=Flavobacterium sp. TaxID=239 RepID=UPI002B4AE68E|nr:TlpA disulfide reductase family protein [Flavobacterium sp.]HLO74172.1 TlpA disulfide reductase family protein [Flavobacterium sp.]